MINNFLHVEYVISLILLSPLEDAFDLDLGRIQCSLESTTLGRYVFRTKQNGKMRNGSPFWLKFDLSQRFKYKKWYSCVSTSNNFPPPHPYLKTTKKRERNWLTVRQYSPVQSTCKSNKQFDKMRWLIIELTCTTPWINNTIDIAWRSKNRLEKCAQNWLGIFFIVQPCDMTSLACVQQTGKERFSRSAVS